MISELSLNGNRPESLIGQGRGKFNIATVRIDLEVPQVGNNEQFIMVFNTENFSSEKGRFLGR
jgi:hypothetical protein